MQDLIAQKLFEMVEIESAPKRGHQCSENSATLHVTDHYIYVLLYLHYYWHGTMVLSSKQLKIVLTLNGMERACCEL